MPPRRSTRPSAESQSTSRPSKSRKAPEPIVVEGSESDDVQEIAPPPKAPPKAKRGRPAKNKVKEEEDLQDEQEIEQTVRSKGKAGGKASTVVPAKRRSNRQAVGEQTDRENTAGETTPAEDAPKRNVRRTSRQPSIAKAPLSKASSRRASGGRRKRGQDEGDQEEEAERPNKKLLIKEEPEPPSEAEEVASESEANKSKNGNGDTTTPASEQPSIGPAADSDAAPPSKGRWPSSKGKGKAKVNDKEQAGDQQSDDATFTPPRSQIKPPRSSQSTSHATPGSKVGAQSKARRNAIPESDTEEERDLLAEAAATPLRPRLGPRESLSVSASQIQQLNSQGLCVIVIRDEC